MPPVDAHSSTSRKTVDIDAARRAEYPEGALTYTERDVILYAISLGCGRKDLKYVYEGDAGFAVLPTFGVIPAFACLGTMPLQELLPNFDPRMLLHGEQYLELPRPLPTSANLLTRPRILDIQDKGRAALVVVAATTFDSATGKVVAENEFTTFVRGSGGFGTTPLAKRKPAAVAVHKPPNRPPDAVVTEKTAEDQAVLYRLNGDYNPLHIDPEFSAVGGFETPILHGLCSFGISSKHVLRTFGNDDPARFKSVKVRFAGVVIPGQTLQTEMWLTSSTTVVFQTRVVETGKLAISNAGVELGKADARARI